MSVTFAIMKQYCFVIKLIKYSCRVKNHSLIYYKAQSQNIQHASYNDSTKHRLFIDGIDLCSKSDVAFIDTRGDFDVAVVSHNLSDEVVGYFWFYLLGVIWMEEYILAAQQFVVAGAVGIWYFVK